MNGEIKVYLYEQKGLAKALFAIEDLQKLEETLLCFGGLFKRGRNKIKIAI